MPTYKTDDMRSNVAKLEKTLANENATIKTVSRVLCNLDSQVIKQKNIKPRLGGLLSDLKNIRYKVERLKEFYNDTRINVENDNIFLNRKLATLHQNPFPQTIQGWEQMQMSNFQTMSINQKQFDNNQGNESDVLGKLKSWGDSLDKYIKDSLQGQKNYHNQLHENLRNENKRASEHPEQYNQVLQYLKNAGMGVLDVFMDIIFDFDNLCYDPCNTMQSIWNGIKDLNTSIYDQKIGEEFKKFINNYNNEDPYQNCLIRQPIQLPSFY